MSNVEQLKAIYKNSLIEKAETLNTLFKEWQTENNEQTEIELHNYLHKLAGSLGMYGFDQLSDNARKIMNSLHTGSSEEIEPELTKLVAFLKQQ